MSQNRGKQFEKVISSSFLSQSDTAVVRLQDTMNGYLGSANICDLVVYNAPNIYFVECKTIHGNTFPLTNISSHQWQGLLEVASVHGAIAGVVCWWVNKDVTMFMPIKTLHKLKLQGKKSIRFDMSNKDFLHIQGKKKRVFFDYDMNKFFKQAKEKYNGVKLFSC